ncbi:MAG: lipid-binding SYLF domain-containing protein [Synergistaceae bacterium]|jgi:lipid-binding SYLF domain-containing protein|nr:lipid-binding SYLF domain-containing protein [Synergistaceae bacterium]
MKSIIKLLLSFIAAVLFLSSTVCGNEASASTPVGRIQDSVNILREMAKQKDASTMGELLAEAKGIAIFPSVIKAGLVFGGQYGEGLVLRRDPGAKKWYGPSFATVAGASWGLQIGAQSIALVLVITNERGLEGFKGNNVKLGGDLAVAAGPVGRRGELGTDYRLKASIYSYSMTKGLFAGLSLEGAAITVDKNANQVYWGTPTTAGTALNKRATGSKITPLINEIERIIRNAK